MVAFITLVKVIDEPALSPVRLAIVTVSGPSIPKSSDWSSPSPSTSLKAVMSITPPSSTPKSKELEEYLGNAVKCNSVPLEKVNVPAAVPSDKEVTVVRALKSTIRTEESSSRTILVAEVNPCKAYPPS